MKLTIVAVATLLVGFMAGLISAIFLPLPQTWGQFSSEYTLTVAEQVSLASTLRRDGQDDLLKRIETRLPEYVLTINGDPQMRSSAHGIPSLSLIKAYYNRNQIPVPEEIRPILADVPDGDLCHPLE